MGALDCVAASKGITVTGSTEAFNVSSNSTINDSNRDVESQKGCSSIYSWRWRVFCDIPLFLIILLLIGLFELAVIPGYKAGFYCNDPKLSFPFKGDTVSMVAIMVGTLVTPLGVFWLTELFFVNDHSSIRRKLVQISRNTGWLYAIYTYGYVFNLSLVEVMKGIAGSPRPNFFEVCQPDTMKACGNSTEYMATFKCTSTAFSTFFQNDSFKSFPSGHASLSVYCGFFLSWYLQSRAFKWSHRTVILVPFLQLTFMSLAAVTSLTRVTDNRHHWWDVLVGVIIGFTTVYYAIKMLCDNFSYIKSKNDDSDENQMEKTPIFNHRIGDASP